MIKLPTLDDRTFAALSDEARALIPAIAPGWTDHNPSDPGIMLVELFAWLAEMVLYRIDRVPERSYRTFLRLLNGSEPTAPDGSSLAIDDAIRATLAQLRDRHRAVSAADFEYLALERWPTFDGVPAMGVPGRVRRARCVPQQSPASLADPNHPVADGHVTLVIAPDSLAADRSALASFDPARRYALELDGASSCVDCGNDASLSLLGDLTLSAWIFPRNPARGRQGLVCKQAAGEFELLLEPGGGLTFYHADAADGATVAAGVPVGRWSHVAAVRSASAKTISFFLDGAAVAAPAPLAKTAVATPAPLLVGARSIGGGFFDGFLRDVCVFGVTRDVVDLGGALKRRPSGSEPGLVACWRLDDGGATAKDAATPDAATTRPRDGTLHATRWRDAVRPLEVTAPLRDGLFAFLDERRLLTTRLDVIGYRALPITVHANLYLLPDGVAAAVRVAAVEALDRLLDPLGRDGADGWPFGRTIFISDVSAALDRLPGVDFVKDVVIDAGDATRLIAGDDGTPVGVALMPHELPGYVLDPSSFNTFQRVGTKWMAS